MAIVYHLVFAALAAYLTHGILDLAKWINWRTYIDRAVAVSAVVGGGTYGLVMFDSDLLPHVLIL